MNNPIKAVKKFLNSDNIKQVAFSHQKDASLKKHTPNLVEFDVLLKPLSDELVAAVSSLYSVDVNDEDFGVIAKITLNVQNDTVIGGRKRLCNLLGNVSVAVHGFDEKSEFLQKVQYTYLLFSPLSINGADGLFQVRDSLNEFLIKLESSLLKSYRRFEYANRLCGNVRRGFGDLGLFVQGGVNRGCCDLAYDSKGVRLRTDANGRITIEMNEGALSEERVAQLLLEAVN